MKRVIYCERCLKEGRITAGAEVHHKTRLTADNLDNPRIALDENNFELLCAECHQREHDKHKPRRWRVDESGRVIGI